MKKTTKFGLFAVHASLALALSAPRASAQTTGDKAAAEALFQAGRDLMTAGKYAEACGKLEASQRLDGGVGTQLYLADCYEKAGRIASAWATFREAESIASGREDRQRAQIAGARAAALEPRLSKLSIMVADGNDPATEVRRDGEPVPRESWGLALPTDPGAHTVEARAPGRKTWTGTASVQGEGKSVSFDVPLLETMPAETAPAPVPVAVGTAPTSTTAPMADSGDGSRGGTQRIVGAVLGGVGIVGLGVGTYFGFHAKSQNNSSIDNCHPDNHNICDEKGFNLRNDARSSANVATALMIGGTAFLATGIVLYVIAPSSHPSSAAVSSLKVGAGAVPGESRVTLEGSW